MGEIESAIGIEQLRKLPGQVAARQEIAQQLSAGLSDLDMLGLPVVAPHCTHSYYVYPMVLDTENLVVSRESIVAALRAEGVKPLSQSYQNIHLLPIFQKKIAYGIEGFPWTAEFCQREVSYDKGICPVAEELQDKTYMGLGLCTYDFDRCDVDLIIEAFRKVWKHLPKLSSV